jgi:hypothetical protein
MTTELQKLQAIANGLRKEGKFPTHKPLGTPEPPVEPFTERDEQVHALWGLLKGTDSKNRRSSRDLATSLGLKNQYDIPGLVQEARQAGYLIGAKHAAGYYRLINDAGELDEEGLADCAQGLRTKAQGILDGALLLERLGQEYLASQQKDPTQVEGYFD